MSDSRLDMINSVESGTKASGKSDLLKYLHGKKITRGAAIKAKCYDCNGMGESRECDITTCSLYPYSPYKSKSLGASPSHRKRGKVTIVEDGVK